MWTLTMRTERIREMKDFLSVGFGIFLVVSTNVMLAYADMPFGGKVVVSFFMIIFFIILVLACKDWNPYSYKIKESEMFFCLAVIFQIIAFLCFIGEAVHKGINCS